MQQGHLRGSFDSCRQAWAESAGIGSSRKIMRSPGHVRAGNAANETTKHCIGQMGLSPDVQKS